MNITPSTAEWSEQTIQILVVDSNGPPRPRPIQAWVIGGLALHPNYGATPADADYWVVSHVASRQMIWWDSTEATAARILRALAGSSIDWTRETITHEDIQTAGAIVRAVDPAHARFHRGRLAVVSV